MVNEKVTEDGMKVCELIEILKTLQPHLTVMHCDGENGYMVVKKCEIEKDYYYTGDEFVALDSK